MPRPTIYAPELVGEICQRLERNPSVRALCRASDMPDRETLRAWRASNPEFAEAYMRARECGFHELAEECLEIADESQFDMTEDEDGKPMVNWEHLKRAQLKIDTRKWYVSKCLPKIYGDRISQEISGPDGEPIRAAVISERPLTPAEFDSQFGVDAAADAG